MLFIHTFYINIAFSANQFEYKLKAVHPSLYITHGCFHTLQGTVQGMWADPVKYWDTWRWRPKTLIKRGMSPSRDMVLLQEPVSISLELCLDHVLCTARVLLVCHMCKVFYSSLAGIMCLTVFWQLTCMFSSADGLQMALLTHLTWVSGGSKWNYRIICFI